MGLKIRKYEWVERFIRDHSQDLPPEVAKSYYAFNLARLQFERGQFGQTLRILSQTYPNDLFTNLDAKVLQIKAWYELGDFEQLEYALGNLKKLVRSKRALSYHRSSYLEFIGFVKRMINLPVYDDGQIDLLGQEIKASEGCWRRYGLWKKWTESLLAHGGKDTLHIFVLFQLFDHRAQFFLLFLRKFFGVDRDPLQFSASDVEVALLEKLLKRYQSFGNRRR